MSRLTTRPTADQPRSGLRPHAIGLLITATLMSGTLASAQQQQQQPQEQAQSTEVASVRPLFELLRFEEDWSAFDAGSGEHCLDALKHVSLTDDDSVWASFGGEFRLRSESWTNFAFSNTNDDSFVLGRALAHVDLHLSDRVRVFVEGKSAFMTGDRDLPGGARTLDVDSLDLQNAFVDVLFPGDGANSVTARVGRQELSFGKQRLVSPLPWANTKRTWDGARVIIKHDRWRIDGFYSRYAAVQKYDFNDWEPGPDFYGVYAAGKVDAGEQVLDLDLFVLGLSTSGSTFNGDTGDENRVTIGARLAGKLTDSPIDFDVEAAYQLGEVGSADIAAYSFASQIGFTLDASSASKPRIFVGVDYASGDDTPGDGEVETFNQLFPLGHAYFGGMDFVGRQNILDVSGGIGFSPVEKVTVKVAGHLFWRASTSDALYNAGGGVVRAGNLSTESEVGQEIDVTVNWKVNPHLTLEGGYSHFFAGDFVQQSGSGEDMDWIYAQMIYKF